MPTVFGVPPSPFVRKVRVFLAEKGIDYDLTPVPPFDMSEEHRKMSPLGKIPFFQDGDVITRDSSIICAYLEKKQPDPALYPGDLGLYARALWFEEYADTKLVEAAGPVFFEKVVKRFIFKQDPDQAKIDQVQAEVQPPVFDYLEAEIGDNENLAGPHFSIADIAITTQLAGLIHAGESVDASRWPKLAAFAERNFARPSFKTCIEGEKQMFSAS